MESNANCLDDKGWPGSIATAISERREVEASASQDSKRRSSASFLASLSGDCAWIINWSSGVAILSFLDVSFFFMSMLNYIQKQGRLHCLLDLFVDLEFPVN